MQAKYSERKVFIISRREGKKYVVASVAVLQLLLLLMPNISFMLTAMTALTGDYSSRLCIFLRVPAINL